MPVITGNSPVGTTIKERINTGFSCFNTPKTLSVELGQAQSLALFVFKDYFCCNRLQQSDIRFLTKMGGGAGSLL